ncbi:MAG: gamma-glutamyl-gamma-aminobutyrate hydrolase family protein [Bacteroidia bacterium]|nr:gamma-glutamyl-gamma-aminobutyrate hydrolase family protein [Bacteroidia bacterium]
MMLRIVCTVLDPSLYSGYGDWLRSLRDAVGVTFVTRREDVAEALADAHGLLLPGGGDPAPALYGRADALPLCNVDQDRDALELEAIEIAIRKEIPILGICRGLQIATVALGGVLIPDLPGAGYDGHHRLDKTDRQHEVHIDPDSMLATLSGEQFAIVNSAHHQGVEQIPPRLRVTARSADGLPEALEWAQPDGKPFLLLVHWHPERLPQGHALKDSIGQAFLDACKERLLKGY